MRLPANVLPGAGMAVAIAIVLTSSRVAEAPVRADDDAVIANSGSTNTAGFRIVVERSGSAELTPMPRRSGEKPGPKHERVPDPLIHDLYADRGAAKPLASLPRPRCMKSVSFGSRLTIEVGADATPDLSCGDGGSAKLGALIRDANRIVELFTARRDVSTRRRPLIVQSSRIPSR
jgi:hypothetical protein